MSAILCADWAKDAAGRAVYVADVLTRVVRRLQASAWSMSIVLEAARRWSSRGSVLVTFDVPLGVPESYLRAARQVQAWHSPFSFLKFLERVHTTTHFFEPTCVARDWSIERPFFSVPSGTGGLTSFIRAAERQGVNLYREIDNKTEAKPLFVKSGIPGSVGHAACALWQELGPRLVKKRSFKVWPFEGELKSLLQSTSIILGEIYPRAAYATALLDGTAESRPRLALAKTEADSRCDAIAQLEDAAWVRQHGVTIKDLHAARTSEHDFDACMTAAALLRSVLEELPLYTAPSSRAWAEGGMLGTGSVNLQMPQRGFRNVRRKPSLTVAEQWRQGAFTRSVSARDRVFRCPIPGCSKEYRNTRGGWDAHVGSVSIHPSWYPELTSPRERKEQFRADFREFFI